MITDDAFTAQPVLQDFLSLVARHKSALARALRSGDVFTPLLLPDENGEYPGNDWANGFMRGMSFCKADWTALLDDEDHGGSLVPILALAHEHDPDPEMRPYQKPISAERRENLIIGAAAGVTHLQIFPATKSSRNVACFRKFNLPPHTAESRTQRAMPLRIRQKVQALLRKDNVSLKADGSDVSVSGFVASVAQFDAAVRKLLL